MCNLILLWLCKSEKTATPNIRKFMEYSSMQPMQTFYEAWFWLTHLASAADQKQMEKTSISLEWKIVTHISLNILCKNLNDFQTFKHHWKLGIQAKQSGKKQTKNRLDDVHNASANDETSSCWVSSYHNARDKWRWKMWWCMFICLSGWKHDI